MSRPASALRSPSADIGLGSPSRGSRTAAPSTIRPPWPIASSPPWQVKNTVVPDRAPDHSRSRDARSDSSTEPPPGEEGPVKFRSQAFSSPKAQWSAPVVRDLTCERCRSIGDAGRFPQCAESEHPSVRSASSLAANDRVRAEVRNADSSLLQCCRLGSLGERAAPRRRSHADEDGVS